MKKIITLFVATSLTCMSFAQTKGLTFDGENDYVSMPEKAGALTGSAVTFEAWLKPSFIGFPSNIINKGNNGNYFNVALMSPMDFFDEAGPTLNVFISNGENNAEAVYPLASEWVNNWNHLAVVYDGSQIIIYVNGAPVQTTPVSGVGNIPVNEQGIVLGASYTGFDNFGGTMDEVRIWNVVRSQAQIQASMTGEISPTTPGLTAYYRMNQGTPFGDNTSITTVTDLATSPTNGVLHNFTLNGATSNFTSGFPFLILPLNNSSFVASKKDGFVQLNWKGFAADGFTTYEIERSENGRSFSKIGALNGTSKEASLAFTDRKPNGGINYYRLRLVNADGRITYSNIVAVKMSAGSGGLVVYPVPVRSSLQLEINQPAGPVDIRVSNLAGITMKTVKTASSGSTIYTSVDLSALSSGTYVVMVGKESKLFVKQ